MYDQAESRLRALISRLVCRASCCNGSVQFFTSKYANRAWRRNEEALRIHSELLPDTLVSHTRLPRPFINQTIRHLKAAGRISAGRPYAPPLTPKDIARIVLALSAASPGGAVAHERDVGRLPRADGAGPANVEAAIVALIVDPASSGQIAIAPSFTELRTSAGSATYGSLPDGCSTFFVIPITAVRAIAHALIERKS